ncbi:hypothetical protein CGLO_04978 [Colletotrichum gloeosporioides Cg-14]|uniref:Heterokaryon incompatibility domain-containing protein n=1 Tax=Colletotrichum gloeosporioides (strain Cg-14) TaxID=1237896 RepID=T0LTM2_COLGC|nr:hypothetical protein CGLO_04978 [Colletotrichum gloeosporioides Cg-14]
MDSEEYYASILRGRCVKCRNIPWHYSSWFEGRSFLDIEHHESWAALEEAAAAGCDICRGLRARALLENGQEIPEGVPCLLRISLSDSKLICLYSIGRKEGLSFWFGFERANGLNIPPEHLLPIKSPSSTQPVEDEMLIEATGLASDTQQSDIDSLVKELINPWIEDCIHQRGRHADCKPVSGGGQDSFYLPTRLINVGDDDCHPVRLIETRDLFPTKPKPEYLALSYCWGKSNEPAKTTRANFQARQRRLDECDFPKTIRDAIDLTRRMGIKYLWVDAVCIIQPTSQDQYLRDWEEEASRMASYYSNARCLISALSASDSSQGIFAERPAQLYPQANTPISFDEARNETLYLPVNELVFHTQFDTQPLLKRGWCFQERLLSPRALQWATNCLFWQCQSLTQASEQDPEDKLSRPIPVFLRDEPQIFQKPPEDALGFSWHRVVVEYTRTNFTYLTDRLIAIESLGTRLAEIHGVEYYAGVFSSKLSRGLLWRLRGDSELFEKLSYFPSWSWASSISSIADPAHFEYAHGSSLKSLIRVGGKGKVFPPAGSAVDFGTPEKRSLRLEAPLLNIIPAGVRAEFEKHHRLRSFKFMDESWSVEVEMIFDAPRLVPEEFGLTTVLLLSVLDYQIEVVMAGLVVRPQEAYYERVGFALFRTPLEPSERSTKLAELMARLEQNRSNVILI